MYRMNVTTCYRYHTLHTYGENLREMFFVIQLGKAREREIGHRTTNSNGLMTREKMDDNTRKTQER